MDEREKQIRFINSSCYNLFTVPDGGNVVINRSDGERLIRPCKYVDETHAEIGSYLYHICEFAEKMEAAGNTYEPENPKKHHNYEIVQRMDFDNRKGVALGYNPNAPEPYVTWGFAEARGEREYRDGRYRKQLAKAKKDFAERCGPHLTNLYTKMVYQFDHTDRLPKPPTKARNKPDEPER